MKKISIDGIALAALIFAVVAIAAVSGVAIYAIESVIDTNERVLATQRAVSSLEAIRFQSLAINVGQQNFAITGDERGLARYRSGVREMEAELAYLEGSKQVHPVLAGNFEALKKAAQQLLTQEKELVDIRRAFGFAAAQAQIRARADEEETDRLHRLSYRMLTEIRKNLDALEREQISFGDNVRRGIIALIAVAALILVFLFAILKRLNLQQRNQQAAMQHQATHDELTGLNNRAAVVEHIDARVKDVTTAALGGFATLLLDLDGFKEVNDSLGHAAGDDLLKQVAARMTEALRESDYLARLGGDEFLVVIPQVSDEETARRVADKLIAAVGVPYQLGSYPANVTLSVGVSLFPRDGRDRETLMKCADQALYQAKHAGKNQAVFYQPAPRMMNKV